LLGESPKTGFFTRRKPVEHDVNPRPWWREAVAEGLFHSGALRILQALSRRYEIAPGNRRKMQRLRRASQQKFAVLCYHRIGTGGIPLFSELPPEVFEAQMRFLRLCYRIVSLDEMCAEMERPTRNGHAVAVTFDDGYRDLYSHALPILRRHQIPATVFLPVDSIETGRVPWYDRIFLTLKVFSENHLELTLDRPRTFQLCSQQARLQAAAEIIQYFRTLPDLDRKAHCERLEAQVKLPSEELKDRMLTWDQVRAMGRAGITFGSHTMTHPVVSRLTDEQLESELCESKQLLEERIATPTRHFAFPFGKPADCGEAALPVLIRCAYRSAATTVEGTNAPGDRLYALRRTQVVNERSVPMFAFKLSQLFFSAEVGDSVAATPVSYPLAGEALVDSRQRYSRVNDA
jgi:peptidoglycan/xylan/chitin deacetylase (PgdA/CDA1 family)